MSMLRSRSLWMPCRDSVASGLAAGLFFANMPMPFQMVPAALVAGLLRGNVPIAMAACWVTNPLTQIPYMLMQFKVGQWLCETLHIPLPFFLENATVHLPKLGRLGLAEFAVGVCFCAVGMAAASFPLIHALSWLMPKYLPKKRQQPSALRMGAAARPPRRLNRPWGG